MNTDDVCNEKKPYESPRLIEHGTVEDLTEIDGCDNISTTCA